MRRVNAVISGQVQGVFFRDTVRQAAHQCGVTGWAKNLRDGRVEVQLQGDEDAVEAMLAVCRQGPPHADVTGIETTELQVDPNLDKFSTR